MNQEQLELALDETQRAVLAGLDAPVKIQAFLDGCAYVAEYTNRSAARVMLERQAHCLDGGLFAAAALRRLGFSPRVVDIFPDPGMDDDHVLAVFKSRGLLGRGGKIQLRRAALPRPGIQHAARADHVVL